MTSYKLSFSDDLLLLFVFSPLQFGVVHCKISKDLEYCMMEKNLTQMGWGGGQGCLRFVSFLCFSFLFSFPFIFSFGVSISLSVCGKTSEFFLFITFFYVIALCKMTQQSLP